MYLFLWYGKVKSVFVKSANVILKRYIFSQLFFLTCLVTLVLTGAIWLTQSLRFVDIIVTRGIAFGTFLYFIFFLLPDLAVLAIPISFLISVLMVYNKLIADHELVVMRAAGCSDISLISPVLRLSGGLLILLYGLTLYVLPLSFQKFRDMEVHFRHHYSSALIHSGEFNHLGNMMIYAQQRTPGGVLTGLLLHDGRDPKHLVTMTAEKGLMLDEKGDIRVILVKGSRQEIDRLTHRPSFLKFDQYVLRLQPAQKSENRHIKPYEMTFFQLLQPAPHLSVAFQEKMRSEVHQRLISPLYALSFGLIAGLLLLQARGRRSGYPLRILSIIMLCALIQGGSLILLQHSTGLSFGILGAYLLVLSPLLLLGVQMIEGQKR